MSPDGVDQILRAVALLTERMVRIETLIEVDITALKADVADHEKRLRKLGESDAKAGRYTTGDLGRVLTVIAAVGGTVLAIIKL